ncbi:MAG: aspartate carbamoyltransferase catalytic subunit [Mycoplasmataceae bacterium]|nr:aspartate carbamoyltransferase catalytic subunit [Mycoplasmataceae bacterium]
MKNLLKLSDLTIKEINHLLDLAQDIKNHKIKNYDKILKEKIVANLFFEASTRTHYSFMTAEQRLNCKVMDFAPGSSSMSKGETFYDTVKTFESFGVDAIVVRHSQNEWYKALIGKTKLTLINGGDGTADHPTQSLLDLLTIYQQFKRFKGLKVLIVGDILHSRVAHSNILVMRRLGMDVKIAAPDEFKDPQYEYVDFNKYYPQVDVINLLRVQNERLQDKMKMSVTQYNKLFGMSMERVKKMKLNAIIIHPAPFNRGVEIDDEVVECSHSRLFQQISNGVYIRMAVLLWALGNK